MTPDNATSPMDASTTVRIPREVVDEAHEERDPDSTVVLPHPSQQQEAAQVWPTTDYGQQAPPEVPPNTYQAQRGSNEFGPLSTQAQQFPPPSR